MPVSSMKNLGLMSHSSGTLRMENPHRGSIDCNILQQRHTTPLPCIQAVDHNLKIDKQISDLFTIIENKGYKNIKKYKNKLEMSYLALQVCDFQTKFHGCCCLLFFVYFLLFETRLFFKKTLLKNNIYTIIKRKIILFIMK